MQRPGHSDRCKRSLVPLSCQPLDEIQWDAILLNVESWKRCRLLHRVHTCCCAADHGATQDRDGANLKRPAPERDLLEAQGRADPQGHRALRPVRRQRVGPGLWSQPEGDHVLEWPL
eukprot:scaffold16140_cov104-Isochrysis_galbana.AAC.1